ncbi:proprotein convertase P-domain-containing protein [Dokdonia sp.]|uniref:proprotein convertase P-domain-containing protein n=1 Tax=Dokdonia sp. TaxID=2024995 RepID=UPI003263D9C4
MKLTKLFTSLFLVGVLFSCSEEELTIEDASTIDSLELVADLSTYTDSSLGMYKGVYTTADSQDRGTVEIKVINNETAKASITYLNGVVEFFNGTVQEQNGLTANDEMNIVFNSSNSRSSSFVFNVNSNGSNPTITDANSNSKASLITVVKENTRGAVVPLTGSFSSDAMSVTAASGTWSIIFNTGTGDGDDTDITTQTIFNTLDFGSATGNSQSGCTTTAGGGSTTCTVEGMYTSQGIDITWNGTHSFTTGVDCSTSSGTWSTANGLSGTFITDAMCIFPCEGMTNTFVGGGAGTDIISNTTFTVAATSTAMGTIGVDADIDNVTLDIFHTFDGDLDITLISPVGTMLDLTSDNGGAGDSFTMTEFRDGAPNITTGAAPFTGMFQPEGGTFAATFDGESTTGNWVLSVTDDAGGDQGTLNSWSISFCDENIVNSAESPVNEEAERRFNKEMEGLTKKEYKRLQRQKKSK